MAALLRHIPATIGHERISREMLAAAALDDACDKRAIAARFWL
jgi:hypothetical protein